MLRILLIALSVIVALLVVAAGGAYFATQHVPDFYEQALAADPTEASKEMFNRTQRLVKHTRERSRWKAVFTAEQLNGYLAVNLRESFPEAIPEEVKEPRLAIREQQMIIAAHYRGDSIETVLSLSFDVYMAEPNVLAVRLHKARAGALPLPLAEVTDLISQAATQLELPFKWETREGDPVALILLPSQHDSHTGLVYLDSVQIGDDAVTVQGRTIRQGPPSLRPPPARPGVADQSIRSDQF